MPVPKKRQSKSRRDKRRANHDRVAAPAVVECPSCGEPKLAHRICPACGKYKGDQVFKTEEE
jgi:large subunit ribosomal protein L32